MPKGSIFYVSLNQKNPNLAKPEVREALKWLTDYASIEESLLRGLFVVHQAFLPKGFLGAVEEKPYKFDLAKAKALLAKAGRARRLQRDDGRAQHVADHATSRRRSRPTGPRPG